MPRLAQCEKAVTISEPTGRRKAGPGVPMESKTPIDLLDLDAVSLDTPVGKGSRFPFNPVWRSVFNRLRVDTAVLRKGLGCAARYIRDGHALRTRGGRFGPNFVTILPTGVCVCSF